VAPRPEHGRDESSTTAKHPSGDQAGGTDRAREREARDGSVTLNIEVCDPRGTVCDKLERLCNGPARGSADREGEVAISRQALPALRKYRLDWATARPGSPDSRGGPAGLRYRLTWSPISHALARVAGVDGHGRYTRDR